MTRGEILSLFARRQEAWRRRDAAALAADHTEDCTLTRARNASDDEFGPCGN